MTTGQAFLNAFYHSPYCMAYVTEPRSANAQTPVILEGKNRAHLNPYYEPILKRVKEIADDMQISYQTIVLSEGDQPCAEWDPSTSTATLVLPLGFIDQYCSNVAAGKNNAHIEFFIRRELFLSLKHRQTHCFDKKFTMKFSTIVVGSLIAAVSVAIFVALGSFLGVIGLVVGIGIIAFALYREIGAYKKFQKQNYYDICCELQADINSLSCQTDVERRATICYLWQNAAASSHSVKKPSLKGSQRSIFYCQPFCKTRVAALLLAQCPKTT